MKSGIFIRKSLRAAGTVSNVRRRMLRRSGGTGWDGLYF